MNESIFTSKISLSTNSGLVSFKIDIIKFETYIEIRLIEMNNIFTLYICTISQSDFYLLKKSQDILVDYDRFIPILVNLFHYVSINKYSAVFINSSLKFIEQNDFRNITKLELKFSKPEENQYKRYLSDLLSRMESDNIKLIKENSVLREKCLGGDKNLLEKIRYIENENNEYRKRMELLKEDVNSIEYKYSKYKNDINDFNNKIYKLENENTELHYKLEKFEKNKDKIEINSKNENMIEELKKEIEIANKIIKKLKNENSEYKKYKNKKENEEDKVKELNMKINELKEKNTKLEEKNKKYKEEIQKKKEKIIKIENEKKSISKKLENAQNVYNHFYNKKMDDSNFDTHDFDMKPDTQI